MKSRWSWIGDIKNVDTFDFESINSDPGGLTAYMKRFPDYKLVAQFTTGYLLYNQLIEIDVSGNGITISMFDNYYFVNSEDGKLKKVNTVRFQPFPDLPPMQISMKSVKFDSWGHLIIQVEPLDVEEAFEDQQDFKEVIRSYLFDKNPSRSFDINSNSFLFVKDIKAS